MIDEKTLQNIENLHRLKTEGVITEDDFEKAKGDLLSGNQRVVRAAARPAQVVHSSELPADDDYFGWVTLPLKRYADFTGRSTRKEFWMFQLIYVAAFVVTALVVSGDREYGEIGALGGMMIFLLIIVLLGLLVPLMAVEVRRLHDQDKSGWLALLNLIPYIGPFVVMVLMLFEGTPGENQYGPDPLDRA